MDPETNTAREDGQYTETLSLDHDNSAVARLRKAFADGSLKAIFDPVTAPYTLRTDEGVAAFLSDMRADSEPERVNDAVLHGDLDSALLDREVEMAISPWGAKTLPGRWKNHKTTVRDWLTVLSEHKVGDKDGAAWLQGPVVAGDRKAQAVPRRSPSTGGRRPPRTVCRTPRRCIGCLGRCGG